MKEYVVTMTITGRCSVLVKADNAEEAKEKAEAFDIVDGSDELIEWEFDEAKHAEENR